MLTVKSIPAFIDNYIWCIENSNNHCVIVDPGDAQPVLHYLQQNNKQLESILITHHHADHVSGIAALKQAFPNVSVLGPAAEKIAGITVPLKGGMQVTLLDYQFQILDLPGHTKGHIGFIGDNKLFCGDVLFSAGCGRIFEGTPDQMFDSLNQIAALPDQTQIYPAHEYTQSNLRFALTIEPDNAQLLSHATRVDQLRTNSKPSLPTTLALEKQINPFLRTSALTVRKALTNRSHSHTPLALFTALREWKDTF